MYIVTVILKKVWRKQHWNWKKNWIELSTWLIYWVIIYQNILNRVVKCDVSNFQIIYIKPQNHIIRTERLIAAVWSATKFQLVSTNITEDIEVQSMVPSQQTSLLLRLFYTKGTDAKLEGFVLYGEIKTSSAHISAANCNGELILANGRFRHVSSE